MSTKIQKWYCTGDTHGQFNRFEWFTEKNCGVVILGDAGINFWLNKRDKALKTLLSNLDTSFYCVRGNHEARPCDVPGMQIVWDNEVKGWVWREKDFPNISYFMDYGIYQLGKYSVAIIGGAYSVDKWYRLYRAGVRSKLDKDYWNPKKTGWFPREQLTAEEMTAAEDLLSGKSFDFVFTHTCPIEYEPKDLFLHQIDQDSVDKTMELWLEELRQKIEWNVWCFGHFHKDRIERPHVEQFFNDIEDLDTIYRRWAVYDETGELDWWLNKSPNFYMS